MKPDCEPAYKTPLATLTDPISIAPTVGPAVCHIGRPVKTSPEAALNIADDKIAAMDGGTGARAGVRVNPIAIADLMRPDELAGVLVDSEQVNGTVRGEDRVAVNRKSG